MRRSAQHVDLDQTAEEDFPDAELAQTGTAIVIVTHDISDRIPEIERVVLMDRGSILADGPTREVLVESRLSALFGRPLELSERDGYYNLW